jgi:hypothetical protein
MNITSNLSKVKVVSLKSKPENWMGKIWASEHGF